MDETLVKKMINLVEVGRISISDIKDETYRVEVESRLNN